MSQRNYSIVIPVVPAHIKYINKLLRELYPAREHILEIILCASSQSEDSEILLNEIVSQSEFRSVLRLETTQASASAGVNRNLGWSLATGKYICFLDADDSYSPHMFDFFDICFKRSNCDLILHDYFRLMPQILLKRKRKLGNLAVVESQELIESTFGKQLHGFDSKRLITVDTNIKLPAKISRFHRIQHGHATVRREIPIRYSTRQVGEDGEFAQRILAQGYGVIYIPRRLSNYDRPTIENLVQSFFLRVIERLSKIKKWLLGRH